jgi:hypothetical protein
MRPFLLTVVALSLVSSLALADPDRGKPGEPAGRGEKKDDKKEDKKEDKKDDKANAAAASAKMAEDDDDEGPMPASDAGKPVVGRRTPAQIALRKQIWERREKAIEAKVHKSGKHLTDEERNAIKKHWHNVSRLMRIRELAQEDKNDAAVKRADVALEREEKSIDAKLEKLNAKTTGGAK